MSHYKRTSKARALLALLVGLACLCLPAMASPLLKAQSVQTLPRPNSPSNSNTTTSKISSDTIEVLVPTTVRRSTTTTSTTQPPAPKPKPKAQAQAPAAAPTTDYSSMEPCGGDLPPCWVKYKESKGNYGAVNPTGCVWTDKDGVRHRGCWGAWQFGTMWAGKLGLPDDLSTATPEEQDNAARALWNGGRGCSNWGAC
jgi:hypothetical protein